MSRASQQFPEAPVNLAQELDHQLHDFRAGRKIRQGLVVVESGDRTLRWTRAFGAAHPDGSPLQPDTPFFIASIDKLLIATIVMQLIEASVGLELDAPITRYLPPTLTAGLHRLKGRDYSAALTVRHLLSHTSGLADWLEDAPAGEPSIAERVMHHGDLGVEWPIEKLLTHVRERLQPHFPPRDLSRPGRPKARYCDTNYILLVAIVEAVTGRPLQEVLERQLVRPLALRATFLAGCSDSGGPGGRPAALWHQGRPLDMPRLLRSVQGIYSTAADLISFLRAFVAGEVFARPATLAAMQQRWSRFGLPLDSAALRAPSWPIEYAFGLMRLKLPRFLTPFAPVPVIVGHSGSTGCWLFHCRELDVFTAGHFSDVEAGAWPFRFVPGLLRTLQPRGRHASLRRPKA